MTETRSPKSGSRAHARPRTRTGAGTHALNAVRGGLIGTAEAVPGVSGGTVALVTGLYEQIVTSAGHVVSGVRTLIADLGRRRGMSRATAEFGRAHWPMLIAVGVGMLAGLLLTARLVESMLHDHPRQAHALFFGLVIASVWVPYTLSGRKWGLREFGIAAISAAAAFVLTGLPPTEVTASPLTITVAAAFAVCALVLPGVSGSFLLLTVGLYEPTIKAVNDRDLGYLAMFAVGAALGLSAFVKILQWLLEHRHRVTLVVMTGLMLGALRALWPWQGDDRELLAPDGSMPSVLLFFGIGAAAVIAVIVAEHALVSRQPPR